MVAHNHVDVERCGAGTDHIDGLRMAALRNENGIRALLRVRALAVEQRHGFGGSSRFVEQRGIGNGQAGQVADNGLEIQQCLESSLRNFSLVGCVGRVPGWVFEDVTQNNIRRNGVVITRADVRLKDFVLTR